MNVKRTSPREVFLSHANADRRFADELCQVLRSHGVRVWYSPKHIVGAQQWHDEIGKALKRCDWFTIILSPASIRSQWVKHELLFALREKRYAGKIVPIQFKTCDHNKLSWTLAGFQMIDFRGAHARGYRDLLRIWGIRYKVHR